MRANPRFWGDTGILLEAMLAGSFFPALVGVLFESECALDYVVGSRFGFEENGAYVQSQDTYSQENHAPKEKEGRYKEKALRDAVAQQSFYAQIGQVQK